MNGPSQRFIVAAFVAAAWFAPALASAQQAIPETDNELLRQGLQLYEEMEYERSVETLSAALIRPGNSVGDQLLIFQTLGTLYVFLNRQQEAEVALERLLCIDGAFDFGEYASPRITQVFDRVRQQWQESGSPCPDQVGSGQPEAAPVTMDHESPDTANPGETLELQVSIEDPDLRVNSVILFYRVQGEEGFDQTPATMVSAGVFEAAIPGDAVGAPAAVYYIQAVSDGGDPLAALGTPRAPLRVPVSSGERRSIARTWWFWTIVGVVVVGAGLGIGLGLGLQDDPPQPPGEATLTISVCDGEDRSVCFNQ